MLVGPPHNGCRKLAVMAQLATMQDRCGRPMSRLARAQGLGALQITVARGECPVRVEMCREASRVGIQPYGVQSPPFFIGFAAVEHRALEFPVMAEHARGEHTETDVCRVLPVVAEWRGHVVHRRRSMHEGDRTEPW